MKEFYDILRSDSGYFNCMAVIISCISKEFHSGILKLFLGKFHQGIKLHTLFSLTDINIRTGIILFSVPVPIINTPKISFD